MVSCGLGSGAEVAVGGRGDGIAVGVATGARALQARIMDKIKLAEDSL
jgi:hypothetical protein